MLSWSIHQEGFLFELHNEKNEPIPFKNWFDVDDRLDSCGINLLKELLENGFAFSSPEGVLIPHIEVCALSPMEQMYLHLPPQYPFDIRVDEIGTLNNQDFKFDWGFYIHADGKRLDVKRVGGVLSIIDGSQYLLTRDQYDLCNALDEFNSLPPESKGFRDNLIKFAEIKELSTQSAAVLSQYLRKESVLVPDSINLKLESVDIENLSIIPEIPKVKETRQFEKRFDRSPKVKNVYPVQGEKNNRQRIVFTDKQIEELNKIKKNRHSSGEQKKLILESPQDVFDPDVINLDSFSSRVIDYGYYKPRFYSFILPYKSEWVPGIVIENEKGEKKKTLVSTKEDLEDLKHIKNLALEKGESTILWEDTELTIDQTNALISSAEKHFREVDGKEQCSSDKVLIVEENVEQLGVSREINNFPALELTYQTPPNLNKSISVLPHQKEGIAWLQSLFRKNPSAQVGGLLADDMGLGKTFQILAFIEWHNRISFTDKPYLIVAPVALLENWEAEYNKFFPEGELATVPLYGSQGHSYINDGVQCFYDKAIYLTTYETLRKRQTLLCAIDWAVIALDEAQRIKTPGTLVTNAAKALKADFKIAATGTPVENTLVDLWSIIDFAIPGLLGSARDFAREFQTPLKDKDADIKNLGETLRDKIGFFIQRRMKDDVLEGLPQKSEKVKFRHMPVVQTDSYEAELKLLSGSREEDKNYKNIILKTLHHLRDISDHPYIREKQIDAYTSEELINSSAKLSLTVDILDEIRSRNEKVILFALRKPTQRMLHKILKERFDLYRVAIINGETPASYRGKSASRATRQSIINHFQAEPGFNAIVMSPIAAGVGLNITSANNIIHYSRHWNPAREDQATDRVYRIGQKNDVYVYYPVATSPSFKTFDIVLNDLLKRKRTLASASLFPTERTEVCPEELFKGVQTINDFTSKKSTPITFSELDIMDPYLFEAAIAVLWEGKGFRMHLTPKSNDKGADAVAFAQDTSLSGKYNFLLQIKHSKNNISDNSIGEIMKAKGFYQQKYNVHFTLAIVTNSSLTSSGKKLANYNDIKVYDRHDLWKMMEEVTLYRESILKMEMKRLSVV